jgi:hypothetical protein
VAAGFSLRLPVQACMSFHHFTDFTQPQGREIQPDFMKFMKSSSIS